MNSLRRARFKLKQGLFPIFKEKNVHIEDVRLWIFLKLNFECNRGLTLRNFRYFGYLDPNSSGVVSFSYHLNSGSKKCAQVATDTYECFKGLDNQYLLHLQLNNKIDRQIIENVFKDDFCEKQVIQERAPKEEIDPKRCILLMDQWRLENKKDKAKQKIHKPTFKPVYYSNVELIDLSECDLKVRVNCKPVLYVPSFAKELAQKLKMDEMKVIEAKREKQSEVDESMCLKEYQVNVETVNEKIEQLKEKYL